MSFTNELKWKIYGKPDMKIRESVFWEDNEIDEEERQISYSVLNAQLVRKGVVTPVHVFLYFCD